MRTVPTTCVLDCPDTCALEVRVEDGAEGAEPRIVSIRGRDDSPTTAGFLCSKVARFDRRVDHPDRVLFPQKRTGPKGSGSFERISWDEALDAIAERFEEVSARWGAEAIVPFNYGGSSGLLGDGFLDDLFFARLGASRLEKSLCALPTGAVQREMYGDMPGVAHEDFEAARFILLWGANPKASSIHLVPFIRRAKKAGAFVAAVDPLKRFSDAEVDLHLPVYPGSDLAVALAMIHLWQEAGALDRAFLDAHATGLGPLLQAASGWPLERAAAEARVPAEDIRTLAEAYAERSPAVVRCGWGVERNRNGGQAAAAILAMPALLGKFGVAGGGYTMSNSAAAPFDAAGAVGLPPWRSRSLNMTRLGELLADGTLSPPIQALFVYNCNPVATVPNQNAVLRGLAREELFTVVSEQVMTDTARWADVLLPATTFLEQRDIRRSYGPYVVGGIRPAVPPRGEAKPNHRLFAALGRRMGFEDEAFRLTEDELLERAAAHLSLAGRPGDLGTFLAGGMQRYDFPGERPVQFGNVSPGGAAGNGAGKIHLTPPCLGEEPYAYLPLPDALPLALVSPGDRHLLTSTFGETSLDELEATLNPADAAARGIASGDSVRVWNELGEVRCRARVSESVRPGAVLMPKGAWRRASANGSTAVALCPDHLNRVAGGACYGDARVEVEGPSERGGVVPRQAGRE